MIFEVLFKDGFKTGVKAWNAAKVEGLLLDLGLFHAIDRIVPEEVEVEGAVDVIKEFDLIRFRRDGSEHHGIVMMRLEHPEGSVRLRVWSLFFITIEEGDVIERFCSPSEWDERRPSPDTLLPPAESEGD